MLKLVQTSLEESRALLESYCEVVRGLYPNITRMQYSIDESTGKISFTILSTHPLKTKENIARYLFSDISEKRLGVYCISNIIFSTENNDGDTFSVRYHKRVRNASVDTFCEKVKQRFKPSIQTVEYKVLTPNRKKIALIISGHFPPGEEKDIEEWIVRNSYNRNIFSISDIVFLKGCDCAEVPADLSRFFLQKMQHGIGVLIAFILQLCRDEK